MVNYFGKTVYNNRNITCQIEGDYLKLFFSNDSHLTIEEFFEQENLIFKNESNKRILFANILRCDIIDPNFIIDCYFDENIFNIKGIGDKPNFIILEIPLKFYIIYDNFNYKDESDYGFALIYQSRHIQKFIGIMLDKVLHFDDEQNKTKTFITGLNYSAALLKTKFKINDKEFYITPGFKASLTNIVNLLPSISLFSKDKVDINDFSKLILVFQIFIKYCLMRCDINPDVLRIINGNWSGQVVVFNEIDNSEEIIHPDYHDSLEWNILYKNAGNIFKFIYDKEIYLENLPAHLNERFIVNSSSISKDASAFEYEFNKNKDDIVEIKEKHKDLKDKIIHDLESKINEDGISRYERDTYKHFLNGIKDKISLSNKMLRSFTKYENCIKKVKDTLKITYTFDEISEECARKRNDVDHGNKYDIDDKTIKSFIMLRCLIYAMQLKRAGFDDVDTDNLTNYLYLS